MFPSLIIFNNITLEDAYSHFTNLKTFIIFKQFKTMVEPQFKTKLTKEDSLDLCPNISLTQE